MAVLITTHDLAEAEKAADRVVIIDRGRVVGAGTPSELMSSSDASDIRFGAPAGLDTAALGKVLAASVDEVTPGEYRVGAAPTPTNIATITAWLAERDLPLADLRAGRQRLEDVFLSLTQVTGEHPAISVDGEVDEPAQGQGRGRRIKQGDRARRRRRGSRDMAGALARVRGNRGRPPRPRPPASPRRRASNCCSPCAAASPCS